ncbi:MAG: FHA domain-containing protein [Candidatus Eisenbacteria bacterium]
MHSDETRIPPPDHSADETLLPTGGVPDFSQVGPEQSATGEFHPPVGSVRPLLGVVAIYSPTAGEPTEPPSEAGRVYPLFDGDILFIGKKDVDEIKVRDGGVRRVTYSHVLVGPEYSMVSREHLAIEMLPEGRFRIYDFSLNGVFLETAHRHVRQGHVRPEIQEVTGPETLILGINLLENQERSARKAVARSRVQVFPIGGGAGA